MSKITLVLIGDDINIAASKKAIIDFKKFNGDNVIAVDTLHSFDFQRMCQEVGAIVYTPNKRLSYPYFLASESDKLIDTFYISTLKPAMMADTEYVMFAEPDCIFTKPINQDILEDNDVIIPSDRSVMKVIWAYAPFWSTVGNDDDERLQNFNRLLEDFDKFCKTVGLDVHEAGRRDMRFSFMANSIIKTDRLRNIFVNEKERIKAVARELAVLSEKYKAAVPNDCFKYITHFSTDQIISIMFGLYLFKWKVNDNGLNASPKDIITEQDLQSLLERDPNIEYIHSCKVYYRKTWNPFSQ